MLFVRFLWYSVSVWKSLSLDYVLPIFEFDTTDKEFHRKVLVRPLGDLREMSYCPYNLFEGVCTIFEI